MSNIVVAKPGDEGSCGRVLRHELTEVFTVASVTGRMLELLIRSGHRREETGATEEPRRPHRGVRGRECETQCVLFFVST